jgi:hypothetical protein
MATLTTTGFTFCTPGHTSRAFQPGSGQRNISPTSGRALEILGHAIEYLTDELVNRIQPVDAHHPQAEAIQVLMAANRQVYYECPIRLTFTERLRAFFRSTLRTGVR